MPKFLGKSDKADMFLNKKGEIIPYYLAPSELVAEEEAKAKSKSTESKNLRDAIMHLESRGKDFDKSGKMLTSKKGALGKMQVMPDTAKNPGFGIEPAKDLSPEELSRVGEQYIEAMDREFSGDTSKILAAYNAGPGKVKGLIEKHGDSWSNFLPKETKDYIADANKILGAQNLEEAITPRDDFDYKKGQMSAIDRIKQEYAKMQSPTPGDPTSVFTFDDALKKAGGKIVPSVWEEAKKVAKYGQAKEQEVAGARIAEDQEQELLRQEAGLPATLPQKPQVTPEPIEVATQQPQGPQLTEEQIKSIQDPYGMSAARDQYMKAMDEQALAQQKEMESKAGYFKAEEDLNSQRAKELKIAGDRHMKEIKQIQDDNQRALMRYQDSVNHFSNMGAIEPGRVWTNASSSAKISAAIAVAAGGAVAGFFGSGQNQALTMFNQIIDRDIEAQRTAYEKGKALTTMNKSLYEMYMAQFEDEIMAFNATKQTLLTTMGMELDAQMASANSMIAKQNMNLIKAQVDQKKAEFNMNFAREMIRRQARMGLMRGGQLNEGLLGMLDPKEDADLIKHVQDTAVRVGGGVYLARNPEMRKTIEEKLPGTQTAIDLSNKIEKVLENTDMKRFSWASETGAKLKQDAAMLKILFMAANKDLRLASDKDMEIIEDIISDPTKISTWWNHAKVKNFREQLQKNRQETLKQGIINYSPNIK